MSELSDKISNVDMEEFTQFYNNAYHLGLSYKDNLHGLKIVKKEDEQGTNYYVAPVLNKPGCPINETFGISIDETKESLSPDETQLIRMMPLFDRDIYFFENEQGNTRLIIFYNEKTMDEILDYTKIETLPMYELKEQIEKICKYS